MALWLISKKKKKVYLLQQFSKSLLGRVEDVTTGDLSLLHHLKDLGEFRKTDDLEGCLDESLGVEVEGLGSVSAVTDVGALDGDHSDDGLEDGSLEGGTGGQTDADDGTAGTDVLVAVSDHCYT